MKKAFLFAASAAVLCSCSTQPKYVVEGDIAGLEGTVYLFQQDSLIDSAVVKSGKFRFSGPAGAPAMHDLLDSRDGQPQAFAMQLAFVILMCDLFFYKSSCYILHLFHHQSI